MLNKLKSPTKICKECFKEFMDESFYSLFNDDSLYCFECSNKLKPKFITRKIGDVKLLSIYEYDETIKSYLFQLKGCYDIEISSLFLNRIKSGIKLYLRGYELLPIPSYYVEDEKRGFNHVIEIFKHLGLTMSFILYKTKDYKQSSMHFNQRKNIKNVLAIKNGESLEGKNVCIVDDVFTTGNTIKTAIELVQKYHPKKIKVVVISMTSYRDKWDTN